MTPGSQQWTSILSEKRWEKEHHSTLAGRWKHTASLTQKHQTVDKTLLIILYVKHVFIHLMEWNAQEEPPFFFNHGKLKDDL